MSRLHHAEPTSPYYKCSRCGTVRELSELEWQEGLLLCKTGDCFDTKVLGSRDADVVRSLEAIASQPDAQPDDKLLNPAPQEPEDILFS